MDLLWKRILAESFLSEQRLIVQQDMDFEFLIAY